MAYQFIMLANKGGHIIH